MTWPPIIRLPPSPTIEELSMRFLVTPSERRRLIENHDPGDEHRNPQGGWCERSPWFRDEIAR